MKPKTIFDKKSRGELSQRIQMLNDGRKPKWGKMTVSQMTKHMKIWNEWILGKGNQTYKQEILGKVFGKLMLKKHSKDDSPMSKGMPAGNFAVKEKVEDLELRKKDWINLIEDYENFSNTHFIHGFYGKMTKEQIGVFVYKHCDHHLRQFEA